MTSTSNPPTIMLPPRSSSNLTSVPIEAKRTGCRPYHKYSNTCSTGFSRVWLSSRVTVIGMSWRFRFSSRHFQPVPATKDDIMHANGPAPGYPSFWLPVTANNPPAPNRKALLAVIVRSACFRKKKKKVLRELWTSWKQTLGFAEIIRSHRGLFSIFFHMYF